MMRLLLIDTCGNEGSIALAEGDTEPRIVASDTLPGRSASEKLIPAIRQLLEIEGWKLRELAAIGVIHGPGSFTGVRVGLSAAKGLSEAGQVPLIAVSRLAVLANAVEKVTDEVCAVLDAGRDEFYCGFYNGRKKTSEALLTAEEIARASEGAGVLVVCEQRTVEKLGLLGPILVNEPGAADALPFVAERVVSGQFDDAATIDANYLRRTDLEISAKIAERTGR